MKYELVLQFRMNDGDLRQFDAITARESEMEKWLEPDAEVDGHDSGSGEMNIFLHTDRPVETFERAKLLIDSRPGVGEVQIAYQSMDSVGDYVILWPPELREFKVV